MITKHDDNVPMPVLWFRLLLIAALTLMILAITSSGAR